MNYHLSVHTIIMPVGKKTNKLTTIPLKYSCKESVCASVHVCMCVYKHLSVYMSVWLCLNPH